MISVEQAPSPGPGRCGYKAMPVPRQGVSDGVVAAVVVIGVVVVWFVPVASDVPVGGTIPVSVRTDVSVVPLMVSVAAVSVTAVSVRLHAAGNTAAPRTAARAMIRRFICSSVWNERWAGHRESRRCIY